MNAAASALPPASSISNRASFTSPFSSYHRRFSRRASMKRFLCLLAALAPAAVPLPAAAQPCPEKNIMYWQAFPAGGESDISARHQQLVLKKKCPKIETVVQYKPGAGGGLMWAQMNALAGDGSNLVGVNLPHIVLQPLEGHVQYKTDDITPVYWFHY